MKLMQFLMGLDDFYMQIRSSILSREVLPDVRSAYVIISSEKSHRVAFGSIAGSSQRNQTFAFVSNVPNRNNFQRNNQNINSGPRPNNLNNNRQGEGSALVCEKCRYNGHTIKRCFKIIGYPADFGKKKSWKSFKGKNISNNNSAGSSSSSGFTNEQMATLISLIKDNKNIVDSGANQHMTYTDKELDNVFDISHLKIKAGHPNGTNAFISKIGNLKLSNGLVLYDVLVIHQYCVTLISVHKLVKENKIIVPFNKSRCYFLNQDLNLRNVLGTGNQCEGLLGHLAEPVLNVLRDSLHLDNKDKMLFADDDLISDQKSQSDSSHSSMSGRDVNTADFPDNSGNDADSNENIFATQNEKVTTLEDNIFPKAISNSWPVFQLDVHNAFLYGNLVEIVYTKPPEGEKILKDVVKTVKVESANQIADLLTKGLDTMQHNDLVEKLVYCFEVTSGSM
ncbi:hypothetical protein Tco_0385094 [Tanacetum coccineum]